MKRTSNIIVTGDVHGNFGQLNKVINKKKPDTVICLGDFGFWPTLFTPDCVKPNDSIVYWIDGNHEHFDNLKKRTSNEIIPGVVYVPRGTVMRVNGLRALFLGGADSIDKQWRTPGHDWFPDELITAQDIAVSIESIEAAGGIDIVFSHTCPKEFSVLDQRWDKVNDPSRIWLSEILNNFKPQRWYFGHWHVEQTGFTNNCRWTCLDYAGHNRGKWWEYL